MLSVTIKLKYPESQQIFFPLSLNSFLCSICLFNIKKKHETSGLGLQIFVLNAALAIMAIKQFYNFVEWIRSNGLEPF